MTMWATLYYVWLKWPCELLFNCFWPKWPCDLPLIIVFLSDHVSYPLFFFTYMTMWANLYYVLLKWPCEILLIVFDLNDHVSYSLLFFILDDHVSYSLLCLTYMTMWATLNCFWPKWPCELPLIIVFPNDPVSYSLLFFT